MRIGRLAGELRRRKGLRTPKEETLPRAIRGAVPLEKEIEKKIGDYAKKHGCLYWKLTSPSNRAVPDRMICTNRGVVGFLEVKRRGCKPTELQLLKMKELKDRGHQVTWCDSVEAGCKFVDDLLNTITVEI